MFLPEPLHGGGDKSRQQRLSATDPQLAGDWIGEKADFLDACPHVIEDGDAALEQRTAIERRLDALRAAVEQANAEEMFEIGDDLRDDRLRHRELLSGLAHASPLRDRHRDMEVLQLQPMSDDGGWRRFRSHSRMLSRATKICVRPMTRAGQ